MESCKNFAVVFKFYRYERNFLMCRGILVFRSKWRKKVLPLYKNEVKEKRLLRLSKKKERGNTDMYRVIWVYLLRRMFGTEGFECPRCCGAMEDEWGKNFLMWENGGVFYDIIFGEEAIES